MDWRSTLLVCFTAGSAFVSSSASAQWAGFDDRSTDLGVDRFTFRDTTPSNENYYDGDFGDFDGDGRIDRALISRYGLLWNRGGGFMVPVSSQVAGMSPNTRTSLTGYNFGDEVNYGNDAVQWVDLDGDGDLDVVQGGNGEPFVIQRNNDGRFTEQARLSGSALNIVNIDLEGDGDVDLAVAHSFCSDAMCGHGCDATDPDECTGSWPKAFTLFVNDGDGNLTPISATDRGLHAGSELIMGVAAGDLDRDGDIDLIYLAGTDRRYQCALNDGDGDFTVTPVDFGNVIRDIGPISGGFAQGTNLADLDGDGNLDIVAGLVRDIGPHPKAGHALLMGSGGCAFTEETATRLRVPDSFDGFLTGANAKVLDLDYDGSFDFIAFDKARNTLDVFLNDGAGNLDYRTDLSISFGNMQDALGNDTDVADLDGDGVYDIWVGSGGADVRMLINTFDGGAAAGEPRNLTVVSANDAMVTLMWDPPAFASTARAYRVLRTTMAGAEPRDRQTIAWVGNRHQDEGLALPVDEFLTTGQLGQTNVTLDNGAVTFVDDGVVAGATYEYAIVHVGPENAASTPTDPVTVAVPATGNDDEAPVVTLLSPPQDHWSRYPRIIATWADQSGVDVATASVTIDGGPAVDLANDATRLDEGGLIVPLLTAVDNNALITVTVSIDDTLGNTGTAQVSYFASVSSANPPSASITPSATSGVAPLTVDFSSSSSDADGEVMRREWHFGDGLTALGTDAQHSFRDPGVYEVLFVARDNEGGIATATTTITVTENDSPVCGDGARNGDEVCDGDDLVGASCGSEGFVAGQLACAGDCSAFDTSACNSCGNDSVDGAEPCDGADLGGATCASRGFTGGALACTAQCTFDVSGCEGEPVIECGDDVAAGNEICDGSDLAGQTCQTLGFTSGMLACSADCQSFDNTGCGSGEDVGVPDVGPDVGGSDDAGVDVPANNGDLDAGGQPSSSGGGGGGDDGCGCQLATTRSPGPLAALGLLVVLVAVWRRRT